jgi:D-alanine-D-alanine ligase-like ATP-grasp enzyme
VQICVVADPWRAHPLAWIHRAEARSIAAELRRAGHEITLTRYRRGEPFAAGTPLLRLSDPVMLLATRALSDEGVAYIGPGAATLERCYDKYSASRLAAEHGIDCPATEGLGVPLILKPRHGSDSLGLRVLRRRPASIPHGYLLQEYVRGYDVTVAVLRGRVGMPLRVMLPEGQPYSFLRKYLLRPRHEPLADFGPARQTAARIARLFLAEWAVRVDFILERDSGRLKFLECDAAPLVGARSAFAASLAAGGCSRPEQLALLLAVGA